MALVLMPTDSLRPKTLRALRSLAKKTREMRP